MREMKDSGIEWIGEIPSDWRVLKLKYASWLKGRIGWQGLRADEFTDDGPYLITGTDFCNGKINWDSCVHISEERYKEAPEIHIKENDMLITKDGTIGKVAVAQYCPQKVSLNSGIFIIRNNGKHKYLPRYLYYVISSNEFTAWFDINNSGNSTIKHLTQDMFYNFLFTFPPFSEQKNIANYLDYKCSEIDILISDTQAQIDSLEEYKRSVITEAVTKGLNPNVEMKDSGIEWVGMIPKHWKCYRGKFILKYMQKPVREDDGVITCFRDGEVTLRSNRREEGFTFSDKEIGYQGIDVGDLVVHGMDGFAGSIGISDSRGKASPVLNVLDSKQNKRYIMYYLRSIAYSNVFLALATGIRVRSCDLRWNKLAELIYPVPQLNEQNEIVDYIENTIIKNDEVIAMKEKQLSTLEEYKKSLIYEYVTGKKEVPNE